MSVIDTIKDKLKEYPQLEYKVAGSTISVYSSSLSGFTVWLSENNPGFTVGFDGWHEEFENEVDALNCFAFGLSDECRLKVIKRGKTTCSLTLESRDGDEWIEDSKAGLIFVPFWKRKKVEYLSNSIIKKKRTNRYRGAFR